MDQGETLSNRHAARHARLPEGHDRGCLELSFPGRYQPDSAGAPRKGSPGAVREIAWRAQRRLAARYRHLAARQLPLNKICVAIARELSAFVWDIARQVKPAA